MKKINIEMLMGPILGLFLGFVAMMISGSRLAMIEIFLLTGIWVELIKKPINKKR